MNGMKISILLLSSGIMNVTAFTQSSSTQLRSCVSKSSFGHTRTHPVFMSEETTSEETDENYSPQELLDQVEALGKRGKKRGKRKGGIDDVQERKASATLAPEEVHYEGPPAKTETIVPTLSILTVVGIVPAAAAWARQAWVRYKITSRRIRVTSGINGNEMAEIVYPDIVEIRTAKRLFGDGDLVAFLRDGARFEVRNIPNFDEAMEFILKQVDEDVADAYKKKGDVSAPPAP